MNGINGGCRCQGCGNPYTFDVLVPNDDWDRIKPEGSCEGGGLLCPACIFERLGWSVAFAFSRAPTIEGEARVAFGLWFFRDIDRETRRKLFALMGMPVDEITTHATERKALDYILGSPLSTPQAKTGAPPPDTLIEYPDGACSAIMFHYLPADVDITATALEHGFALKTRDLDEDDDADLYAKYHSDDCDLAEILPAWQPVPPEGFKLAGKWDTEDGLVAIFIAPIPTADAKGPRQ